MLLFRLINMFSVFGDTVLDPFLGTGTTTLAAIAAGRNSVSFESDSAFSSLVRTRIMENPEQLSSYNKERVTKYLDFVAHHLQEKGSLKYLNSYFGFPVMTRQEQQLKLLVLQAVKEQGENLYKAGYFNDQEAKTILLDEPFLAFGLQIPWAVIRFNADSAC